MNKVFFGDCRDSMRDLIAQGVKVQMCVTSPPYWGGLRDYGRAGQLGLERDPADYVATMVQVFAVLRDLLTDDGTPTSTRFDAMTRNTPIEALQAISDICSESAIDDRSARLRIAAIAFHALKQRAVA